MTPLLGNLYAALAQDARFAEQTFDVILANPPYIPEFPGVGHNEEVFGGGGLTGEDITERIVRGAASALTASGRMHITTNIMQPTGWQRKVDRWWAGGACSFQVLHGQAWTNKYYAGLV